jgi:4'-phosphopantetheinyl transferase EntD
MLADLFPPAVAAVEVFGDADGVAGAPLVDAPLFEAEAAVVATAVDKRQREFTAVRACARVALDRLGLPPAPILPGVRGAPIWPSGVVGSMTHCEGYRAAALARARDVRSIGIDAEPDRPLPPGVLDLIALDAERVMVDELDGRDGIHWDRLLFSAKEAVYKAWFPLTQHWLDFQEARITIDPHGGTFAAALLVPSPVSGFTGRWQASQGLVVTAIVAS